MSSNKLTYLSIFICTVCICIPALINNFPFIYSDSGTYISTGFSNYVSNIRPATYGIFIRHLSLKESFWIVIFTQSLIVVWFIRLFIKTFFNKISEFFIILIVSLLTVTTSIGITTGMLMPDFTTPILIMASSILIYSKKLHWRNLLLVCLGLWFSISSHHSHAYILFLILFFVAIRIAIQEKSIFKIPYKKFALLGFILVLGYLTIPFLHYQKNGKFVSNESSNIFLLGRINQMGLLKPFLDEKCEEHNFSICNYKDEIPQNFLWDPASPVYQDKGWESNNKLYKEVVASFITSPSYVKKAIIKTIETGTQQIFSFETVKLDPLKPKEWPEYEFEYHMPDCIPQLRGSAQNRGVWNNEALNKLQYLIVFSSSLFLLYMFFFQSRIKMDALHRNIFYLILISLLSNAFICGGISMIAHRFQSRIIWIIPLFACCMLYQFWKDIFKLLKAGSQKKPA